MRGCSDSGTLANVECALMQLMAVIITHMFNIKLLSNLSTTLGNPPVAFLVCIILDMMCMYSLWIIRGPNL